MSKDPQEGKSEKIMDEETKALWYPDSKKNTHMNRFRAHINKDYGVDLGELKGETGDYAVGYFCLLIFAGLAIVMSYNGIIQYYQIIERCELKLIGSMHLPIQYAPMFWT